MNTDKPVPRLIKKRGKIQLTNTRNENSNSTRAIEGIRGYYEQLYNYKFDR